MLSLKRPLYVSRFVSALVLVAGCVSALPAIAIAHDSRLEPHDQLMSPLREATTPTTTWCPAVQLAPVVLVSRTEILMSGVGIATPGEGLGVERPVFEELAETYKQFVDLHDQAGDLDSGKDLSVNLVADAATPLATIEGIARATQRAHFRFLDLVSTMPDTSGETWAIPTIHHHTCALRIEFADDGQPITDFADYPSLFRAAENARGTLRVRVLSAAAGSTPR